MKKMIFTGAIMLFSLISVEAQTTIEELEVAHYRAFCEGVVPKQCLVIKREGSLNFGTILDEIENFEFIPGYHYTLMVEIEKVNAPPKDTSGYIYRLKEIVNRKPIADPVRDIDLYGNKWRLVEMNGKPVNRSSGAWLVLSGHSAAAHGYGGCNSFSGNFSLNENVLRVGPLRSTKRACLVDWGVEDGFLAGLGSSDGFEVDQERLILKREGKSVLEFVPFE